MNHKGDPSYGATNEAPTRDLGPNPAWAASSGRTVPPLSSPELVTAKSPAHAVSTYMAVY